MVQPQINDVTPEEGDQMFFIAYGQSRCKKIVDKAMRRHLVTFNHSSGKWRVNGVVMNNHDFASVFNCPKNTPMNPKNKCQIW